MIFENSFCRERGVSLGYFCTKEAARSLLTKFPFCVFIKVAGYLLGSSGEYGRPREVAPKLTKNTERRTKGLDVFY